MRTYTDEWLCVGIVQETPEAIIFADKEGVIRLWNQGAQAIFGYRAEEALGQTLDLIVPERQRERHWEGFHNAMAAGTTKYGAELLSVPATRRDGTRISLEFSVALLRDPAGEVLGVAAVMRDVTKRWQEQKELRARLAILEAQRSTAGADPSD